MKIVYSSHSATRMAVIGTTKTMTTNVVIGDIDFIPINDKFLMKVVTELIANQIRPSSRILTKALTKLFRILLSPPSESVSELNIDIFFNRICQKKK